MNLNILVVKKYSSSFFFDQFFSDIEDTVSPPTPSFVLNCPRCAMPFQTSIELDRHLEAEHEIADMDCLDDLDMLEGDEILEGMDTKRIVVRLY